MDADSVEDAGRQCLDLVRRLIESEREAGMSLDVLWLEIFDEDRVRVALLPVAGSKVLDNGDR